MSLQEACETLEELLDRNEESNGCLLSMKEFFAINNILLELQVSGKYILPEKYEEGL